MATQKSYAYIRRYYRVPAYVGALVSIAGRLAKLIRNRDGQYLKFRFLDDAKRIRLAHPTSEVIYCIEAKHG